MRLNRTAIIIAILSALTLWGSADVLSSVISAKSHLKLADKTAHPGKTFVPTIAALRAYNHTNTDTAAFVQGYYIPGDGGGGWYHLQTGDTITADDGGGTIVSSDGSRWSLVNNGVVSAKQFGAMGDGVGLKSSDCHPTPSDPRFRTNWDTRDFVGIQRMLDYAGTHHLSAYIPAGQYILSKCLIAKYDNMKIYGDGMSKSRLIQSASKADWFAEVSDDSQFLVGGTVYASTDYYSGAKWQKTRQFDVNNVTIRDLSIEGDMKGFPKVLQSGLQLSGTLNKFAKNNKVLRVLVSGHAECGIEPSYQDSLVIQGCYATHNGWQFIGTDHAIKNVLINDNTANEPAVGNSESAFLDLEDGQGADYENITVSNNIHTATMSGFVKAHPKNGTSIKGLTITGNRSTASGAKTLGFYAQFFGGMANKDSGAVTDLVIANNVIKGYRGNVFKIGATEAGAGKALRTIVKHNSIETALTGSTGYPSIFYLSKNVENCLITENNVIIHYAGYDFASISQSQPYNQATISRDIVIRNNTFNCERAYALNVNQVDGLNIEGNTINTTASSGKGFGGVLGFMPGGKKSNIIVQGNRFKLSGGRPLVSTTNQRVTNLQIINNEVMLQRNLSEKALFDINQQTQGVVILGNHISYGN